MKDKYLIYKLSETIKTTSRIDKELFEKYNVKRGLRNADFSGVLVGLTKIADVVGCAVLLRKLFRHVMPQKEHVASLDDSKTAPADKKQQTHYQKPFHSMPSIKYRVPARQARVSGER